MRGGLIMEKEKVLELVKQYYKENHEKKVYKKGDRINYAGRVYDEEEMCNLVDSALDFWLTAGKYTDEFEKGLAKFLNVPYCSLVNSGSSANLLAIMALTSQLLGERRVKRGDEIITVAAAFPTTVSPIIQCGAVPVFVDISIPSYNLDVKMLEQALSDKTKAVFIAHSLGNVFDLHTIKDFCDKHNLWLVEDNCDALGGEYEINGETKLTGTIGDIGTSSFYPAHQMTMGEGGAVYTSNPLLNKIIRSMRDWGRDCVCSGGQDDTCNRRFEGQYGTLPEGYDHKYVYSHLGYNLKATDMQAAIGVSQLKKLPSFVEKRRGNWDYLKENLKGLEESIILPEKEHKASPCWFGFIISIKEGSPKTRGEIVAYLEKYNIQTRSLFAGNITRHPCFDGLANGKDYRIVGNLEKTDFAMNNSFWVGVYPGMTKEMLDEMVKRIRESIEIK
jgi:CDP-6-deoxy-D-xylo-4-hexulose-3-dehydrase